MLGVQLLFFKGVSNSSKSATSSKKVAKIIIQLKALEDLTTEPLVDGGKSFNSFVKYIIDFGNSELIEKDLNGYKITLYNSSNQVLEEKTCESDGYFEFNYYKDLNYFILSKGQYSNKIEFKSSKIRGQLEFYIDFV